MPATRTATRTDTAQAARYVSARVWGDLQSIYEKFAMGPLEELADLAHDVQVGLAEDCLAELRLFLYPPGASLPGRIYRYERVAAGSFAPSRHSGGIERSRELLGGRIEYEVTPRSREAWDRLKNEGQLRISWRRCTGRSMSGMTRRADGGYARSDLGLSRTVYTR